MGNNAAFTSFEASVLATYNRGVLDRDLLDALARPYADTDIDRGGMTGDLARDGLDVDGIILSLYGIDLAKPDLPGDYRTWTSEQRRANDDYYEAQYEALRPIEQGWGWR